MSSIYDHHLPLAFPYCFVVPAENAVVCVSLLLRNSAICPNGSSFAIDSATKFGYRHLWLSKASFQLVKNVILAGSSPEPEVSEPVEDDQSRVITPKTTLDNDDLKAMIAFREQLDGLNTGEDFA